MNAVRSFQSHLSIPLQINTKLILTTGSHAGTEAPIELGYYMIGRHKECQIRPKSRSVSRRHCLLHRYQSGIRVYDLGSTSGTKVNGHLLEPNEWLTLNDGDKLQCGKVVFDVSVKVPRTQGSGAASAAANSVANHQAAVSMVKGEAWHEFNVVGFLEAEDEAEREHRYDSIRSRNEEKSDEDESIHDFDDFPADPLEVTSHDLVADDEEAKAVVAEARLKIQTEAEQPQETVSPRARRIAAIRAKIEAERAKNAKSKKASKKRAVKASMSVTPETVEAIKLYAVILLTLVACCIVIYSGYQFVSGPPVRVIEGID